MKNYVTLVEEPLIIKDFRFMIMRGLIFRSLVNDLQVDRVCRLVVLFH